MVGWNVQSHCKNCTQCVVESGTGRKYKPQLKPIAVGRVFQIVGVDTYYGTA